MENQMAEYIKALLCTSVTLLRTRAGLESSFCTEHWEMTKQIAKLAWENPEELEEIHFQFTKYMLETHPNKGISFYQIMDTVCADVLKICAILVTTEERLQMTSDELEAEIQVKLLKQQLAEQK